MIFQQMKNIDTAFKYTRMISLLVIGASGLLSGFALHTAYAMVRDAQNKIYVLAGSKAFEAMAANRKENIPVEARDHIRSFHEWFFTLDPDEKVIGANIGRALYLADGSAKQAYDNLKESGYYNSIVAGNISQSIDIDSIQLNLDRSPWYFKCFATQTITRTTSTLTRRLVTEGNLRNTSRSDHNPHGFLIEKWNTLENKDIKTEHR